jgi:L-lactate dehydrogenase complex protein LldG
MATREAFLAKVRAAQPEARERPEVPLFASTGGDLRGRFTVALAGMGGTCVEAASGADVLALIRERFGAEASVCSATPEVSGTRPLSADTPPVSLQDVDVGVVRARFGVAETGSV